MVKYKVSISLDGRTRISYEEFLSDEHAQEEWRKAREKEEHGGVLTFTKIDKESFKPLGVEYK
tara:strand:- start:4197 stop:4385 length:189 start_codon:yes stop_codon:yes gene_type:complete